MKAIDDWLIDWLKMLVLLNGDNAYFEHSSASCQPPQITESPLNALHAIQALYFLKVDQTSGVLLYVLWIPVFCTLQTPLSNPVCLVAFLLSVQVDVVLKQVFPELESGFISISSGSKQQGLCEHAFFFFFFRLIK